MTPDRNPVAESCPYGIPENLSNFDLAWILPYRLIRCCQDGTGAAVLVAQGQEDRGPMKGRGGVGVQKYFFIAFGGALGSLTRYWVGAAVADRMGTRFPYGTFIINITACAIIGFSIVFLDQHTGWSPAWRFMIPVGFVGAYSTFSTFEWETFVNLRTGDFAIAALYVASSIVLGLVGVWCGVAIAKAIG